MGCDVSPAVPIHWATRSIHEYDALTVGWMWSLLRSRVRADESKNRLRPTAARIVESMPVSFFQFGGLIQT